MPLARFSRHFFSLTVDAVYDDDDDDDENEKCTTREKLPLLPPRQQELKESMFDLCVSLYSSPLSSIVDCCLPIEMK